MKAVGVSPCRTPPRPRYFTPPRPRYTSATDKAPLLPASITKRKNMPCTKDRLTCEADARRIQLSKSKLSGEMKAVKSKIRLSYKMKAVGVSASIDSVYTPHASVYTDKSFLRLRFCRRWPDFLIPHPASCLLGWLAVFLCLHAHGRVCIFLLVL